MYLQNKTMKKPIFPMLLLLTLIKILIEVTFNLIAPLFKSVSPRPEPDMEHDLTIFPVDKPANID